MERPTVVDLFAGAGGFSEGFRQAGFRVVAGSDIDPDACATYSLNFPGTPTIVGDIRDASVRRALLEAGADASVLVGGPPCQAFSQVRNHSRLIDDPRNSLYREFVAVVAAITPRAFVMENVPGMDQMGVREQVEEDLALDGEYHVASKVVDAVDFGVPQRRRRILFVGVHTSLGVPPRLPAGTGASGAVELSRFNGSYPSRYRLRAAGDRGAEVLRLLADPDDIAAVSAEQAIGDLRHLRAGTRCDVTAASRLPAPASAYQRLMREGLGGTLANTSVPRINADTVMRLAKIPKGGNHRDLPEELLARYLTGAKWGPHAGNGRLSRRHYYAYRKLHPALWSWTLNTKADSVYHYGGARALSVREFARLQSFPDRFVITTDPRTGPLPGRIDGGAAHSRYRQVGNAVPPLLARAVANALLEVLT